MGYQVKCNTFKKGAVGWRLAVFSSGKKGLQHGISPTHLQRTLSGRGAQVQRRELRAIGKMLGRSASTISGELQRNATRSDGRYATKPRTSSQVAVGTRVHRLWIRGQVWRSDAGNVQIGR